MPEREVVLLLGADIGDPVVQCALAEEAIAERIAAVIARSRDHWTEPWGFTADTLFLNRALLVRTAMEPAALMATCLSIEAELGRVRSAGATPRSRTIDIDILLIGSEVIRTEAVHIPHPRMHLRPFALAPLCDLWPAWEHPELHRTALQLLDAIPLH
ncbi:MAG: 2-amino-4-hydroxy-6-hydroxymethyldihydropteridine diphosphokinase [Flavobacteriales bacterium]|nr:2-amino-4-hydroxy-6-hydroxymethyldihydropteridine diphosphokinase [Flavobacteriales bacterium]HPF90596.1 2-amino-4-hydroxy-6-hydroxymethyldihydropteridine diphosphokinase [Flavobacteriales bacterium]